MATGAPLFKYCIFLADYPQGEGQGVCTSEDGNGQTFGPGTLLIFGPGENHSIRALEELVFIGFLHGK